MKLSSIKTRLSELPAEALQVLLGLIGAAYLGFFEFTTRWKLFGRFGRPEPWRDAKPCILVFWHGRQLLLPGIRRVSRSRKISKGIYALASQHRDGRFIAHALRFLGIHSVAGSSSRRGMRASLELIEKLREGYDIAITPDGPRGPIHEVKVGAVRIAQLSGALMYPLAASAKSHRAFKSWDKMILPFPFTRAAMGIGEPIAVPPDATDEDLKRIALEVKQAIDKLTEEADVQCSS
jgi:lysophospholipid acyltransferase (LPLAT)-like uncharacterized protein